MYNDTGDRKRPKFGNVLSRAFRMRDIEQVNLCEAVGVKIRVFKINCCGGRGAGWGRGRMASVERTENEGMAGA